MMTKQEFYERCAAILKVADYNYYPYPRRRRFGQRRLGNGTFPEKAAAIRWFSPTCIQIFVNDKAEVFSSPDSALEFLDDIYS